MKTELKDLKPGQSLLHAVRKYNDGSYGVCIAEMRKNQTVNVAALFNTADSRFAQSQPKAQHAWQRTTAEDLQKLFGINVATLVYDQVDSKGREFALPGILNPSYQGNRFVVQSMDSTSATVGTATYTVKRFGKIGTPSEFIPTKGGLPINNRKIVTVESQRADVVINKDGQMSPSEYEQFVAIGAPVEESIAD